MKCKLNFFGQKITKKVQFGRVTATGRARRTRYLDLSRALGRGQPRARRVAVTFPISCKGVFAKKKMPDKLLR